jgi:acetyltransferase-like isoleucine patch superfamily enzyme
MISIIKKIYNSLQNKSVRSEMRAPEKQLIRSCILGSGSKLYECAKIINSSGQSDKIRIGSNTHILGSLTVWINAGVIEIGNHVFIGEDTRLFSAKKIVIGNRVQIAHSCNIFDNNVHSLDPELRHLEFIENTNRGLNKINDLREAEVIIEDDVWIGASCNILKGIHIGRGAVIGAGSVVTKNVSTYEVVAGNPARKIGIINSNS